MYKQSAARVGLLTTEDFENYIGPNFDIYESTRLSIAGGKPLVLGWNWLAFFMLPSWLIYRRQYDLAVGLLFILVLPIVIGVLVPSVSQFTDAIQSVVSALPIVATLYGRNLIIYRSVPVIRKADEMQLKGDERSEFLRQNGGVNVFWAWLAPILFFAVLALLFFLTGQYVA